MTMTATRKCFLPIGSENFFNRINYLALQGCASEPGSPASGWLCTRTRLGPPWLQLRWQQSLFKHFDNILTPWEWWQHLRSSLVAIEMIVVLSLWLQHPKIKRVMTDLVKHLDNILETWGWWQHLCLWEKDQTWSPHAPTTQSPQIQPRVSSLYIEREKMC